MGLGNFDTKDLECFSEEEGQLQVCEEVSHENAMSVAARHAVETLTGCGSDNGSDARNADDDSCREIGPKASLERYQRVAEEMRNELGSLTAHDAEFYDARHPSDTHNEIYLFGPYGHIWQCLPCAYDAICSLSRESSRHGERKNSVTYNEDKSSHLE